MKKTQLTTAMTQTRHDNDVQACLRKPYSRVVTPEADGTYRAEIIEFPGCVTTGENAQEALARLEETASAWLSSAFSQRLKIPEPIEASGAFSGKLMLRLPKSLHRRATYAASVDGVSLNQYIVTGLAEQVGAASSKGTRSIMAWVVNHASTGQINQARFVDVSGFQGWHVQGLLAPKSGLMAEDRHA